VEEVDLYCPFPNGSRGEKVDPKGQEWIDTINELCQWLRGGKDVYIKLTKGDRKGTIAKFVLDPEDIPKGAETRVQRVYYDRKKYEVRYEIDGYCFRGRLIWDGRRNKIQMTLPDYYTGAHWLKGYAGPTVYERLDKKKVAKKAIESIPQKDIDGKVLKVGDKVLYCNIRYGGGTVLCKGTVKEFKAKVGVGYNDKVRKQVFTIILNEDGEEQSKIESSDCMIKKFKW